MDFPNDKELAQLQADATQRDLMRSNPRFLQFFRGGLILFLVVGIIALLWILCCHRQLYPIVFLTLWNVCVVFMIRLVSTHLRESQD